MLQDFLVPEELLQVNKLQSAIDLTDETSFFAILGVNSSKLAEAFEKHYTKNIQLFSPQTDHILEELIHEPKNLLFINLYNQTQDEFIKNLLFYRDFIADNDLQIILLVNQDHYKNISKNAIDLYNIATFSYLFIDLAVQNITNIDTTKPYQLLQEYQTKRKSLSKKQKLFFLLDIAKEYDNIADTHSALKYFNLALNLAKVLKLHADIHRLKYSLAVCYERIGQYTIAEKYLLEAQKYFKDKDTKNYLIMVSQLASLYISTEHKKALQFCDKSYELALDLNNKEMELTALNHYRRFYIRKNDTENINIYTKKIEELAHTLHREDVLAEINHSNAIIAINNEQNYKGKDYLEQAFSFYKQNKNEYMMHQLYVLSANLYLNLHDYTKSLSYCAKCLTYFTSHNYKDDLLRTLKIYSRIFGNQLEYDKALETLFKMLKLSKSLNFKVETFETYLYISSTYGQQNYYDKALDTLKLASKFISSDLESLHLYARYSDTYKSMNNLAMAYNYYNKALEIFKNTKENDSEQTYLDELYAEILIKDEKSDESLKYFEKSLRLAKKTNEIKRIHSVEENIAYLYKKIENKPMAIKFFTEVINSLEVFDNNNPKIDIIKNEISLLKQ